MWRLVGTGHWMICRSLPPPLPFQHRAFLTYFPQILEIRSSQRSSQLITWLIPTCYVGTLMERFL
jgi:hypothetical protein